MQRADASQPNMGLTSFSGLQPRRSEVAIAKNYLNVEELETLNRIVMFYLDFAELQACGRRTMTMSDWIKKLDDFVKLSDREVLTHAGRISAEAANQKARRNEHYRQQMDALPAPVEQAMTRVLEATHKKNWLVRQEGTRQVCRETDYIERRWHKKMTAITFFCAAVSRPPQL